MTTRIDVGAVLLDRARTIIKMKRAGLDLRWLHEFDTASLAACCECIAENQLEPITKEENIQRELIQNLGFAAFYVKLLEALSIESGPDRGIYPFLLSNLNGLLEACQEHSRDVTRYSVQNITEILKGNYLTGYARLVALENFDLCGRDSEARETVIRNVSHCVEIPLALSDKEKALLQEPFVAFTDLTGYVPFSEVFALLDRYPELPDIARLLHKKGVEDRLVLKDYQKMAESVSEYAPSLRGLIASLDLAPLNMFLGYWKAGGCLLHELQAMKRLLDTQPDQDWPALLGMRSAYTNTLYGRKFKSFDLSELSEDKEGVVIYAISHNKKHFIKLVDGCPDVFLNIPANSVLFQKGLYDGHFNINELTEKTLGAFAGITTYNFRPDRLEPGRRYSFQELSALAGKASPYWSFYHGLYGWAKPYAKEGFCVAYPESRSDFLTEGQQLNHCVGAKMYYENHILGRNMIFFIRKTEAPGKPYFTAEIGMDTGRVRQLYGFGDCSAPKEVRAFTEGFAKTAVKWKSAEMQRVAG